MPACIRNASAYAAPQWCKKPIKIGITAIPGITPRQFRGVPQPARCGRNSLIHRRFLIKLAASHGKS
jgi:hypothetical protein